PLAEALPGLLARGESVDAALAQLLALLDEVAAVEARIAPVKAQWHQGDHQPGAELRELLSRLTRNLEHLSGHIQAADLEANARKCRLRPELDRGILSRQMQRAYGETTAPAPADH